MVGWVAPWLRPTAVESTKLMRGLSGSLITRPFQQMRTPQAPFRKQEPPKWLADREQALEQFQTVLNGNKEWAAKMQQENPGLFERQAVSQNPDYLWIGCSDARVPAETLTGLEGGELFVHRNIANLVVATDINLLSVLTYAVEKLKVKHIIVCGHYSCGGVKAATATDEDLGVIEHWLRHIRDVYRLHMTELMTIVDEEVRYRRLVELNVAEQCINLYKTGIVQQSRIQTGYPLIHGVVYELRDGLLKELNIDLVGYMKQYSGVYKLYEHT